MAANSAEKLLRAFLSTTSPSSKRTISLANLICERCGLRNKQTIRKPKPVLYDAMGRKVVFTHMKLCCLASEKHRIGPKIVSEANLIASKFPKISGGPYLRTHYEPDHLKSDGDGPAIEPNFLPLGLYWKCSSDTRLFFRYFPIIVHSENFARD